MKRQKFFEVEAALPEALRDDARFRQGMVVQGTIRVKDHGHVFAIPREFVRQRNGAPGIDRPAGWFTRWQPLPDTAVPVSDYWLVPCEAPDRPSRFDRCIAL